VRRFAVRFQQFSAPVTAKGVEDTAFYRYFPLSSLNEVGGEPDRFGIEVEEFHALSTDRALRWPHTMLATSTHDNKRSEDVRNRIDVLSELPNEWVLALTRWRACAATRAASWPARTHLRAPTSTCCTRRCWARCRRRADAASAPAYAERIWQYMQKAAREAKLRTRWTQPDAAYEAALEGFVRAIVEHGRGRLPVGHPAAGRPAVVVRRVERAHAHAAEVRLAGRARPVPGQRADRAEPGRPGQPPAGGLRAAPAATRRTQALGAAGVHAGLAARVRALAAAPHDGRAKLWFIWRLLSLRRAQPALFREGSYEGLVAEGALARHVVAFARRHEDQMLLVVAGRLFVGLCPEDSAAPVLALPGEGRGATRLRAAAGAGRRGAREPADRRALHRARRRDALVAEALAPCAVGRFRCGAGGVVICSYADATISYVPHGQG
jgi:(1->4)-alpha-D-glucan 1-alpha-D-glucosylmutase